MTELQCKCVNVMLHLVGYRQKQLPGRKYRKTFFECQERPSKLDL